MKSKGNNEELPLHRTLHYRRLREIVTALCQYEEININEYDIYNARAYSCIGDSLKGKNVRTKAYNKKNNHSCFVSNNEYEVIEYPKKTNSKSFTGDFLVLIRNKSFDYWLFGLMTHEFDSKRSVEVQNFVERVTYTIFGKYLIVTTDSAASIKKTHSGSQCVFGGNQSKYKYFDSFGSRKKAYGVSIQQFLSNRYGTGNNYNKNAVIDRAQVKVFNKKQTKRKYRN